MIRPKIIPTAWSALLLATCAVAVAEQARNLSGETRQKSEFLRLVRDASDTPVVMQAAIVRFAPSDGGRKGPTVDLIAAVHLADKDYYEQLNREFKTYDVVLYEMVAPKGTKIPKGGGDAGGNPVAMIQLAMKNILALEFQLEQIDYTPKNMVHADMSPEEFANSMRKKGETAWTMLMRMLKYALSQQNKKAGKTSDAELLMALFNKDRALLLKRLMAEQFQDMEGMLGALSGPDGSTIVTERNKVVLKVLGQQIAAGKRKIAIFYGAGHMSDIKKRLSDDFGLVPIRTRWVTAWDMKAKPRPAPKAKRKKQSANLP